MNSPKRIKLLEDVVAAHRSGTREQQFASFVALDEHDNWTQAREDRATVKRVQATYASWMRGECVDSSKSTALRIALEGTEL